MTVTRIKIVSTQGGVTDTYVVESDYDALAARLAEAERAILDLWRGQIRCGYSCNHSNNAAHVDGEVWRDVAARFQHVINPDRAADSAAPATSAAAPGKE